MSAPAPIVEHKVKIAIGVGKHGAAPYVVECTCGASSQLFQGQDAARAWFRAHSGRSMPE